MFCFSDINIDIEKHLNWSLVKAKVRGGGKKGTISKQNPFSWCVFKLYKDQL